MQQINITLQGPEEDGQTIKLIVGDQQHQTHHLNLQQARSLATELIQLVHQAGVKNSLNRKQSSAPFMLARTHQT